MKELSLNILDIAQNSVKAGADEISIIIDETEDTLQITISDNGCGMSKEMVENVMNPFFTTRTTRNVGLGVPLLKLAAEQTEGKIEIESVTVQENPDKHGTDVKALFYKNHLDFTPLGDVISTITTLIQGSPDIEWLFEHNRPGNDVKLDTRELRAILGDVPLDNYEVIKWIEGYLVEAYEES